MLRFGEKMMFCPRCDAEYRSGFTRCSECDVPLVYRFPIRSGLRPETESELVVLRTFTNNFEVDLARTTLEAAGIESMIRTGDSGGRGLILSFIELLVRAEDKDDAEQILNLDVR